VPGQSSEFGGAFRFERPIDALVLALGLQSGPEHRVSLESNERNFLFLMVKSHNEKLRPCRVAPCMLCSRISDFGVYIQVCICRSSAA
jgi:hypothetical protein